MSEYGWIILIQLACIFLWVVVVKLKNAEKPEFDAWLSTKLQNDPRVTVEEAFNEYILNFEIMNRTGMGDPILVSEAKIKLDLIEEYNIDEVLGGDEHYEGFKQSLNSTLGNDQHQYESGYAA